MGQKQRENVYNHYFVNLEDNSLWKLALKLLAILTALFKEGTFANSCCYQSLYVLIFFFFSEIFCGFPPIPKQERNHELCFRSFNRLKHCSSGTLEGLLLQKTGFNFACWELQPAEGSHNASPHSLNALPEGEPYRGEDSTSASICPCCGRHIHPPAPISQQHSTQHPLGQGQGRWRCAGQPAQPCLASAPPRGLPAAGGLLLVSVSSAAVGAGRAEHVGRCS